MKLKELPYIPLDVHALPCIAWQAVSTASCSTQCSDPPFPATSSQAVLLQMRVSVQLSRLESSQRHTGLDTLSALLK